jgi:isocitrate dehydrogenase
VEGSLKLPKYKRGPQAKKDLVGVDLFVHWPGEKAEDLAAIMHGVSRNGIKLSMITNRGIKVYPDGFPETFCTDHWRCRFVPENEGTISKKDIIALLQAAEEKGADVIKTENLYAFDGKKAYSLGQGQ